MEMIIKGGVPDSKNLWENLNGLVQDGEIPPLDQKRDFEWYLWAPKRYGAHHSIVVVCPKSNYSFFTLEMLFLLEDEKVIPFTRIAPAEEKEKWYPQGTVTTTVRKLASLTEGLVEEKGSYSQVTNNCQGFCNDFTSKITGIPVPLVSNHGSNALVARGTLLASIIGGALFGVPAFIAPLAMLKSHEIGERHQRILWANKGDGKYTL